MPGRLNNIPEDEGAGPSGNRAVPDDDVEGHSRFTEQPDDDVEGHGPGVPKAIDDDDVEGHGFGGNDMRFSGPSSRGE